MAEKTIHLSGDIGESNTPSNVKEQIEGFKLKPDDTIRVVINSEGGSVFDGFDIYNQLKALDNKVITEVRGMAASIASLIMLAGDEIELSQASTVMIHRAMTMAMGNSEEIEKQVKVLNTIDDVLISIYSARTGLEKTDVGNLLSEETWFTAEEAVEAKLADTVIHKAAAKFAAQINYNMNDKKNALQKLFAKWTNETEVVEETTKEEVVENANETEVTQEAQNVTREEFEQLAAAFQELLAALSVEGEEEEAPEETEEEAKAKETAEAEKIEGLVEAKLSNLIKNMKASTAQPANGNGSLTKDPNAYVDPHAAFRAKQNEIELNTRNK